MPFRTALSGLNASSADLRVIGNNIANASTTGFKKSRTEFADIFASSSSNAIGTGVKIASVSQQFSQGNVGFTDSNLDLAVSGDGFLRMNDGGVNVYTRAGALGVDRNGFIVNTQNQILTGFQADAAGNITGALGDLQLNTSNIAPNATTSIALGLNLDASAAVPSATATTSLTLPAGIILDGDAPAGWVAGPTFTINDNYGTLRSVHLEFNNTGGAGSDLFDIRLVDETAGAGGPFPAGASIDISSGTPSPASVNFSWVPQTAAGAQTTVPITMGISATIVPAAANGDTTAVATAATKNNGSAQGAFSATDSSSYNHSTSLSIYDSLGTEHLLTTYYRKETEANTWMSYTFSDGVQVAGGTVSDDMVFSTAGALTSPLAPSTIVIPGFNPGGGAALMNLSLDVSGISQYGSAFSVDSIVQDGFTTGRLSAIDIGETGIVNARFTNGQSRTLAQVALANFSNTQGLRQLGDSTWAESFESGAALVGQPGTGSLGFIQSGALEGSNVDLTEQLVNMITAQRNFQANAQVISTADTVTQTIINIR
jgi:flagellar hook protein FlgE